MFQILKFILPQIMRAAVLSASTLLLFMAGIHFCFFNGDSNLTVGVGLAGIVVAVLVSMNCLHRVVDSLEKSWVIADMDF